ncbi:type 1 glutamine amidotransferase domain-containing protein [Pseudovibrio brasiliensis]|uniref:Type 1 glutamine amidotransferase domain-containing protein n=1 Tax=Pseudovibrio brasiliensis TaxID=1898042 RepID=A0ABX8AYI2_9HYPH|nr:type 1 glutamine amidotransferase domain-containing protein [Pseudovibrio brasiliensis]QUS58361.1 type 1 glutamine amidotransferase domain-containing protein [Pseudovibrio brasiliensis]
MNVLMVLTSHDKLGNTGEKTGFWLEELAAPYYVFKDAGATITLASPAGGQPPLDPKSDLPDFQTPATDRFKADRAANEALANTVKLESVSADAFDAVFYPGGHGPLWDLVDNTASISLIEQLNSANKPVGVVCHASAALVNAKAADGSALVKGKKVTGFSNTEEDAVQLTDVVPLLVEDALQEKGAIYEKGPDWGSFILEDGNLISGQNPASSEAAANAVLARLR